MRWIDIPPVWLLVFLALAWGQAQAWPGVRLPDWTQVPGAALVGAAILLFAAAGVEFLRHRTTIIPHDRPSALISTGVFALTRNPIYLADALVLAGMSLLWGSVAGVLLTPVFMWLIARRFIEGEEARLAAAFGPAFHAYAARVRRWI